MNSKLKETFQYIFIVLVIIVTIGATLWFHNNYRKVVNTEREPTVAKVIYTNYIPSRIIGVNPIPMTRSEQYQVELSYNNQQYTLTDSESYNACKDKEWVKIWYITETTVRNDVYHSVEIRE